MAYNIITVRDRADQNREEQKDGYLHLDAAAPGGIPDDLTEPVKIQLMRYLYKHHPDLPGLGGTPQAKYFSGYSLDDVERLGNDGERGYYNLVIK